MIAAVTVSARGAARWRAGHPWIYRSDVDDTHAAPGVVVVRDRRGRTVGRALWSPVSEIRLRMLTHDDAPIDRAWWRGALERAARRRAALGIDATAFRLVHAEGDGLPSLVVDRYGDYLVAQFLSSGLEALRDDVVAALQETFQPAGILLRHDASVRRHERLTVAVEDAAGAVPDEVEVREGGLRYVARLRTGQKTGAFLDQRENRMLMGAAARGNALDVFAYHGLFALHLAARSDAVTAVESSGPALEAARANAALNGVTRVEWVEANAFDALRGFEREGRLFDAIVLDPPAFAKRKESVTRATAAYKEVNLRAARLLAPGGVLLTCSCSFHLPRGRFLDMLAAAAADSGRRLVLERLVGQAADHPEVITVPETGYLKGALLRADD